MSAIKSRSCNINKNPKDCITLILPILLNSEMQTVENLDLKFEEINFDEQNQVYLCKCAANFKDLMDYKNHYANCHSTLEHYCKICKIIFKNKEKLELHMMSHRSTRCHICGKYYKGKEHLEIHKEKGHQEINIVCPSCGLLFIDKQYYDVHCREKHKGLRYQCNICKKLFHFNFSLKLHETSVHNPDRPKFTCFSCGKVLTSLDGYKKHLNNHKGVNKKIFCTICSKGFPCESKYKAHYESEHEGLRHECDICKKEFKLKGDLTVHMKSHSTETSTCPTCGKEVKHINRHMKTHERSSCICDICGKSFTTGTGLKLHLMLHNGEKRYNCKTCGRKFNKVNTLRVHERIHTKAKPYSCDTCDKKFTQSNALTMHIRSVHTGEKPYECHVCQKRFINKTLMNYHINKTHGVTSSEIKTNILTE